MPNRDVPVNSKIRLAADRSRLLKTRMGISACRLRDSMTPKAARNATAAESEARTLVSAQCETPSGVVAALDSP
jgi:D-alanyl-D-alanine dipeptidase